MSPVGPEPGFGFMLQECNPHFPTKNWKVVKVEEHDGNVNQVVVVLSKESVAPIETARGVLSFGFSAIHIKVYKGDSNSASSSAGNPAERWILIYTNFSPLSNLMVDMSESSTPIG